MINLPFAYDWITWVYNKFISILQLAFFYKYLAILLHLIS